MKQATGIDFNGMENSNFSIESTSTGLFYKHIRINPTSLILEVWNGSSWVAPGTGGSTTINTSKVVAIPTIMYHLIPVGVADNWIITGNEAGNERWFNNINTCFATVTALAQANTSKRYKILIYPGVYNLTANISILNNMQIELMHGAEISGNGYVVNMTNGALLGSGLVNADVLSTVTGNNLAIIPKSEYNQAVKFFF
jgi:hypothetical protein